MAKDLKFDDGSVYATIRVDSISGAGNVSVLETYGLDDRRPDTDGFLDWQVGLLSMFDKEVFSIQDFVQFATDESLNLKISDTNGDNESTLV